MIPQFLIAAPTSGSGKTTVSRGLMALLRRHGHEVQPYKCGPDYIDTKYHTAVCGRPSVNLDGFMATPGHLQQLYVRYAQGATACVVEGMMGMYDGYDRHQGSAASIAALLRLPVLLVVDARSAGYSIAPLLAGFLHFRPEAEVVGVLFNRVGSDRHREMLQQVCHDLQVPCIGFLPRRPELEQGSRYLGLDFSSSSGSDAIDTLVDLLEHHVDWQQLLQLTLRPLPEAPASAPVAPWPRRHILVARDEEAFSFLYQEHIDLLRACGPVTFFRPAADEPLPADTDLLYLPGGYPEKHRSELLAARRRLASIHDYIEQGGAALAECGGMIYLSQGWADVLPIRISDEATHRRLSLGYRQMHYRGQMLRGHEFHYTQMVECAPSLRSVAQLYDARGREVGSPLFRHKNLLAGYPHLYWGETDLKQLFSD